jgi:HPt (histidine-containing phosphotransfer) domain-containing protein
MNGGGAILDPDTVQGLRELGGADHPGLVMELIRVFLEDASDQMQRMAAAWDRDDLASVSSAAHALKSAGAHIGALSFSDTCKDVELSAKSGECEAASAHVRRCRGMFTELQAVLAPMRGPD